MIRPIPRNALVLACIVSGLGSLPAAAKAPGKTYCYNEVCRRVLSVQETEALVGRQELQVSSYYDNCERDPTNPCSLTSSGEVLDGDAADNAASPIYPNGTVLRLFNPETKQSVQVRINNSGPYHKDRLLDVSRATAEALGFAQRGLARLEVTIVAAPIPDPSQRSVVDAGSEPIRIKRKPANPPATLQVLESISAELPSSPR